MIDSTEITILGPSEITSDQEGDIRIHTEARERSPEELEAMHWTLARDIQALDPQYGRAGDPRRVRLDALPPEMESVLQERVPEAWHDSVREKILLLAVGGARPPESVPVFSLLDVISPNAATAQGREAIVISGGERRQLSTAKRIGRIILAVLLGWQIGSDVGIISQGPVQLARQAQANNQVTETSTEAGSPSPENRVHEFSPLIAELSPMGSNWRIGGDVAPKIIQSEDPAYPNIIEFGSIDSWNESWFSFTADLFGTLEFSAQASTEENRDIFAVEVNGETVMTASGMQNAWLPYQIPLSPGDQVVLRYEKDLTVSHGNDAVWVRNLHITPFDTGALTDTSSDNVDDEPDELPESSDAENTEVSYELGDPLDDQEVSVFQNLIAGSIKASATAGDVPPKVLTPEGNEELLIEFSGLIENQSSSLIFIAEEDGTFSLFGKTDSEFKSDKLIIFVNGEERASISGQHQEWILMETAVTTGDHIEVQFMNDGTVAIGKNLAWIRNVTLLGSGETNVLQETPEQEADVNVSQDSSDQGESVVTTEEVDQDTEEVADSPLETLFESNESLEHIHISSENGPYPYTQHETFFSGDAAVEFKGENPNQTSSITLTSPVSGLVEFVWKASTLENSGVLWVFLNDNPRGSITGSTVWQKSSFTVEAGDTIRFSYQSGDINDSSNDLAWLDQITFSEE